MITSCTACIVHVTVLLLCTGTRSMDANAHFGSNRLNKVISNDLSQLLPDGPEAEGTLTIADFSYESGYDRCWFAR
jgi:hypothetical protein